jgi:hypothetical protein
MECPKCHGRMEEGFIKDDTYGEVRVATWIQGAPEKSWWGTMKTKGKANIPVVTLRCSRCGYLESYAKETRTED